jgi:excisionase family DNA binding protein
MPSYNATVELTDRSSDQLADHLVDNLADYSPAVSRSVGGRLEVVLTVPADSLRQAVITALALVAAAGHDAYAVEVLPTDEFDRRLGLEPVPELLSVTEAAAALGVSRQAVQQRIDAGTLPARKVGKAYAVPQAAVTRKPPTQVVFGERYEAEAYLTSRAGGSAGYEVIRAGEEWTVAKASALGDHPKE